MSCSYCKVCLICQIVSFDWMNMFLKTDNSVGHSGGFLHARRVNDRHSHLEQLIEMYGRRKFK